ncbi:MAG: NlpC/P60 family protein [Opitutaceae bacterium]|jgi:cell wall-associated NlpC family hydrolase
MITPEQISALEAAAETWRGTPFCEGSPVQGAGVSCHHLPAELYFDAGLLTRLPIPNGPSKWTGGQDRSLIVEWVEASGLFIEISGREFLPGDVLGFRLGHCIHHAALALGGGRIVHSVVGHGVSIEPSIPYAWEKRLEKIWRIKALS